MSIISYVDVLNKKLIENITSDDSFHFHIEWMSCMEWCVIHVYQFTVLVPTYKYLLSSQDGYRTTSSFTWYNNRTECYIMFA